MKKMEPDDLMSTQDWNQLFLLAHDAAHKVGLSKATKTYLLALADKCGFRADAAKEGRYVP